MHTPFGHSRELRTVTVVLRRVFLLDEAGYGFAILRPDGVVICEWSRKVPRDNDNRKVAVLQAVVGLVRRVEVTGVKERGSHSTCLGRVEYEPVLTRDLIEPVVLRMARGLPASCFCRLS